MTERPPAVYVNGLEAVRGADPELRALAQELTVTETYFFRNAEQLSALTEVALPEGARSSRRAGVAHLSAGAPRARRFIHSRSSAGEVPGLAGWPGVDPGLDVNPAMLERAGRGPLLAVGAARDAARIQSATFRADGASWSLERGVSRVRDVRERNLRRRGPASGAPERSTSSSVKTC